VNARRGKPSAAVGTATFMIDPEMGDNAFNPPRLLR
jgi:hypothetical protein